jgi:glycosyltransferase involved in cell wall biosynthesis
MEATEELWRIARETIGDGRLSVVMPVFRLADDIAANLKSTAELFESHSLPAELVPVDDGSPDITGKEILEFSKGANYRHVSVRPVICPANGGKGAALRAGFAASSGEFVMLLDGDLDISPVQTPFFFSAMREAGADIVVGSKRHPASSVQYPWHRRIVSWVYFTIVRIAVGLPITDTQTGMKLFRRRMLGEALDRMLVKTYAFDLELLAIARERGAKIAEAPVVIRFGSKFGALKPSTVWAMAKDSLAVFYRLRFLRYYAKAEVPPKLATRPLVTVVVACPGDSAMLRECLAGIAAQTWDRVETLVLPDGPLDGIASESVRVIPTGKVRPAEKRNAGIAAANGEIIAFIDDDAHPDRHWLEYAVKYFGDETVGAVGGPGVTPPEDPYLAKAGGRVYDSVLVSGNYRYRYKAGGVRRDVDDYPSCNLLVRTDILRRINGYRTDFWPGEDTLLCKDIVDAGYRIVYDPWVIVFHHRRALFGPHLRQLGRYAFHRGYFVKRFPSNSLHFSYFVPSAFVAYLAALAVAFAVAAACGEADSAAMLAFAAPGAAYLALVLLTTVSLNPATWLLAAAGVVASHVCYGVRFVQGLLARRAPCEFIGKDHAK